MPSEAPTATTTLPEQLPTATATSETVHLPAVEGGGPAEQPAQPPPVEQPVAPAEAEPPSEPSQTTPPPAKGEEIDMARLIDGIVVMLSYVWLGCGVLLLLAVPVGFVLLNRWGRRRRETRQGRDEP